MGGINDPSNPGTKRRSQASQFSLQVIEITFFSFLHGPFMSMGSVPIPLCLPGTKGLQSIQV